MGDTHDVGPSAGSMISRLRNSSNLAETCFLKWKGILRGRWATGNIIP